MSVLSTWTPDNPNDEACGRFHGLVLENISHQYGQNLSLSDVSLVVPYGDVLCLLGQSGCGKTTLMRIVAGVEKQSRGRVVLNGAEVAGSNSFLPAERRGVGLMFQDYALFPHMSVLANVSYGLRHLARSAAKAQALEALKRVRLAAYADKYPHELSGGEQQRVALARAIAPRPSILLMDEPFSGLDRRLRDSVRDEMLEILKQTNATCIIVTHDPEDAMRMGDTIALMHKGQIVQHASPEELYRDPKDMFVARFFSELCEFQGKVGANGIETVLGVFPSGDLPVGASVEMGIRPHNITLRTPQEDDVCGTIRSIRFVGEVDLCSLDVEGLSKPLDARIKAGNGFQVGMTVGIVTNPHDVLTFQSK
ncbi:MAG: ABC transporter ATP-binding protein [Rhodobacteraceae bacterium]|nr:ABC transporter ATP-binding protein [Paracoccaceae bacterium]